MLDNHDNNNNTFNDNTTPQDKKLDVNSSVNETADSTKAEQSASTNEGSYEWNTENKSNTNGGEYHYSYVNGKNVNAAHNPNNYENVYSSTPNNDQTSSTTGYDSTNTQTNSAYSDTTPHSSNPNSNSYGGYSTQNSTPYNGYSQQPYQTNAYGATPHVKAQKVKKPKQKKPKKPVSRGFIAASLVITILASSALGFGGGYLANSLNSSSNGSLNINQVSASNTSSDTTSTAGTTSAIVKQTADSVVEIATESVVTGNFQQQYVQQGAGSGVIISEDGYIITNHHVIEGANDVKVTLRDGTTTYPATIIGSDEDNDIALLKVEATGLSPATFGDSSTLAVGDYVVAIGNPLGELGGTVTDGIISALAREVTIENKSMTLLQTNAQINPGNSGGGLFNENGELVGIVNAKDSATEIEGIGFAIPINNVLDIINDLKSYGYVTGKIDTGMQFTDITSQESAFYYGVNQTGCYVLSVTQGSNAETAGFKSGDLVTKVNGTDVSKSADVDKALENSNVGDKVAFTVSRNGQSVDLTLTLAEYTPSSGTGGQSSTTPTNSQSDSGSNSDDSIWSQMFGW